MPDPTPAITPEKLTALDMAWQLGLTDTNACKFAELEPRALYRHQERNPEYCQHKLYMKAYPNIRAEQTITNDLDSISSAKWYAERTIEKFKPKKDINVNHYAVISDEQLQARIEHLSHAQLENDAEEAEYEEISENDESTSG